MMNSQYQHQQQPQSIPHYQATGPSTGSSYQQGHQRLNSTGSTPTNIWELQNPQNPPQAPQRNHNKRPAPQPGQLHVSTVPSKPTLHVSHHSSHNQSTYNNPPQFINSQTQTTPPISLGHQHSQHSPKSPNQQFMHSTNVMSTSLTSHNTNLNNGGPVNSLLHVNSSVSGGSCLTNANANHNNNNISSNNNNFDNPNLNCTSTNATSSTSLSSSLVASTMSSGQVAHYGAVASSLHSSKKIDPKLQEMPWFHGSITREEAERLLQPRDDGLFLVRESTNYPGDYTLCVCFQGKVEHYRVKYEKNLLTIDDEEYFENLEKLIKHYENDADGLCTQLIRCLPKVCIKKHIGEKWIINESELTLKENIGKGEFGEVKLGLWKTQSVAVKVLKNLTVEFLKEAKMMSKLRHENIVTFHGVAQKNCYIHLIFEYMSKGSLVDYLRSRGRQHVTKKDQIDFAYDTCSGMAYLESENVIHRDLAARNVLISENNVAKICDLGLACYNDSKNESHIDVGKLPIKWTAPESLKGHGFSNKSDMWSFGILLWEIYSFGRVPYPRIPLAEVVKYVDQGYKMEAPEACPQDVYEMMKKAWDLNPQKRPDFRHLKAELETLKNNTH